MKHYYSLYGRLLSQSVLTEAFREVKRNWGAPGIDGQSLNAFEANLEPELSCLLVELKEKRYQAQPVRRVVIPKLGGGERLLGIPTVRDRIVQQALKALLAPLFDRDFIRLVTVTARDGVHIRPSARLSCSFDDIIGNGSWIWICRNASTR